MGAKGFSCGREKGKQFAPGSRQSHGVGVHFFIGESTKSLHLRGWKAVTQGCDSAGTV